MNFQVLGFIMPVWGRWRRGYVCGKKMYFSLLVLVLIVLYAFPVGNVEVMSMVGEIL